MSKYLTTWVHKAQEIAPREEILAVIPTMPHYVIDPTLLDLMRREDSTKAIEAMVEAQVARLPFPEMALEFELNHETGWRHFVILVEEPHLGFIAAKHAMMKADKLFLHEGALKATIDQDEHGKARLGIEGPYGEARHMPVHWRAGHARHQAYGPNMSLRKTIYIPPVLVNFKPEDGVAPDAVKPPHKVLAK